MFFQLDEVSEFVTVKDVYSRTELLNIAVETCHPCWKFLWRQRQNGFGRQIWKIMDFGHEFLLKVDKIVKSLGQHPDLLFVLDRQIIHDNPVSGPVMVSLDTNLQCEEGQRFASRLEMEKAVITSSNWAILSIALFSIEICNLLLLAESENPYTK